ncbi:AcrR family transcriptional regulator [Arthrobacter woluwensis]|uniref:TetR/AcrR family transcriptional regulator n=1 Tax=Arthrobacter woluwensis TaxID=156980 RepID=UPI002784CDF3|nr:hypothetical protein [Arthrobacter woluwensis]MDQ0708753.1 AcrR family transcriptional regulator [Arthrobacter woluwensis]
MKQDRRDAICEAAVGLLACDGARGLTHQAVDRRLNLPLGSTSYYFRTRHALLEATGRWIATRSRAALEQGLSGPSDRAPGARSRPDAGRPDVGEAAVVIARQLRLLLTDRRDQALARTALLGERSLPPELRDALAHCLFSVPLAEELMTALGAVEPREAARDLVTFLEGLIAENLWSASGTPDPAEVAARVRRHLERLLPLG